MVHGNEFGIARVSQQDGDNVIVDGRCYNGKISIGTEFQKLSKAIVEKTSNGYEGGGRIPIATLRLTVTKIVAYQRELAEIESGLTARLTLSGTGADQLSEDTVLGTD